MLTKNSGGGVSTLIAPERVQCRTPSSNKKPKTIARWKFDALRKAILRVVPRRGDGLAISDLEPLVREQLTEDELLRIRVLRWYTTLVKLELEVRGEITRMEGVKPQRLLKTV